MIDVIPHSSTEEKLAFTGERGIPLIHLLKSGVDIRKYFLIVSNLLDILEVEESCFFNI